MKWSFIEKLIYRGFIEKHFVSKCKVLTEAQALQSYILFQWAELMTQIKYN